MALNFLQGGLWEAAVKSFKNYFKRLMRSDNLIYKHVHAVVVQIERMMKAWPSCPLLVDEDDSAVSTPTHIFINRQLNSIIDPVVSNLR